LASGDALNARARLIKTRRGTWIDESLLPAARRECLDILREAARKAVGEDIYLPGWISLESFGVEAKAIDLSTERLEWKLTPTQQKADEEADATIDVLEARGAFEGLGFWERLRFELYVTERIQEKYESQIEREVEEAASRKRIPKSNPTLVTEKELLDFALDQLDERGILDSIMHQSFTRAPLEELDAWELAREAHKTARWCGCCGRELAAKEPAYFGARVYVGMWPLYWDRVSKPKLCKPDYQRTVLCETCAPEWLSPDRADVVTQLCAHCERPMVSPLKLSSLRRTFCSNSCQRAYDNQLRKEKRAAERKKVCEVCGKEFTAWRDAKTCSDACRKTASRRRKREVQRKQ
jgi:hypothetical protein